MGYKYLNVWSTYTQYYISPSEQKLLEHVLSFLQLMPKRQLLIKKKKKNKSNAKSRISF